MKCTLKSEHNNVWSGLHALAIAPAKFTPRRTQNNSEVANCNDSGLLQTERVSGAVSGEISAHRSYLAYMYFYNPRSPLRSSGGDPGGSGGSKDPALS